MDTRQKREGVLSPSLALFNGHLNRATKKAKRAFKQMFGPVAWKKEMEPLVKSGIMVILQEPPTLYTSFYVHTVFAFVNEHRYLSKEQKELLDEFYLKKEPHG